MKVKVRSGNDMPIVVLISLFLSVVAIVALKYKGITKEQQYEDELIKIISEYPTIELLILITLNGWIVDSYIKVSWMFYLCKALIYFLIIIKFISTIKIAIKNIILLFTKGQKILWWIAHLIPLFFGIAAFEIVGVGIMMISTICMYPYILMLGTMNAHLFWKFIIKNS